MWSYQALTVFMILLPGFITRAILLLHPKSEAE